MKKLFIIALTLMLVLSACQMSGNIGNVAKENETVQIAWIGPLSGETASLGKDNLGGAQLAVKEINEKGGIRGKKVQLIIEDDEMKEKQTLMAYHKITGLYDVKAILSPSYGGVLSLAPIVESTDKVIINSLDTSEELAQAGKNVFAVGIYDEGIGYTLASFAEKKGFKSAGVIFNTDDPFMVLIKDSFADKFEGDVKTSAYVGATTDFRQQVIKLQDVDVIIVLGWDEAGLAVKQIRQLGIEKPIFGIDTVTSKDFLENAGEAAEGMYFTSWDSETSKYKRFLEDFKSLRGALPEQPLFAAAGYDSVMVVAKSLESDLPLTESLYELEDFQGVTGTISMSQDGIVRTVREQMFQVRDGNFKRIS